jgi:carbon-monoxide dehydrogenase iron sulfur subunit
VPHRKIFTINRESCTGCRICEMVCSLKWEGEGVNPTRSRIKIISCPEKGIFVPRVCRFCRSPSCVSSCPKGALSREAETGIIMVDEEKCVGCGLCVEACDFGGISLHPEKNSVMICDLCGGDPLCVRYCMNETLVFLRPEDYRIVKDRSLLDRQALSIWPEDPARDGP